MDVTFDTAEPCQCGRVKVRKREGKGVASPRPGCIKKSLTCVLFPQNDNARDAFAITLGVHRNIRLFFSRRCRHRRYRKDSRGYSTPEKRVLAGPGHLHLARTYTVPSHPNHFLSFADDHNSFPLRLLYPKNPYGYNATTSSQF
jgi:hypothetical protein